MSLSWNQIRIKAKQFSEEWKDEFYEKGEAQSFHNDLFDVFGVKRRSVARFEEHVKKLNNTTGYIDLFWPGVLLVEQKSAGYNLKKASIQASEYFDALDESEKPRYQLVCDFQTFELLDRDTGTSVSFTLADLHKYVESFAFVLGKQKPLYSAQEPVNIQAAHLVGSLHDSLENSGYDGHQLEQFLVRLVFCIFADDTGIFQPRDSFLDLIESRTAKDGSDLGNWLTLLFQTLNTEENKRQNTLDDDLSQFPFINGGLFNENLIIPSFSSGMREKLIEVSKFDWSDISPAIFGALFQSVLSKEERRKLGGHFTSEANILKVVDELFADVLRIELDEILNSKVHQKEALLLFQKKLGNLTFFDPACGCGNFLAIAYRELRRIELDGLKALSKLGGLDLSSPTLSVVDVNNFYGIEVREFSARIAETAMWMTDHILNNHLSLELETVYYRVPLRKAPSIVVEDALTADWKKILKPSQCNFILANPPYAGSKKQTNPQRKLIRKIAGLTGSGGTLDYVTGWMLKAASYAQKHTQMAFVTTNSITQGEQVGQLWPELFGRYNLDISFAHRVFAWQSEATGKANVHVVIIGLNNKSNTPARRNLYSYDEPFSAPVKSTHKRISPYLINADKLNNPQTIVHETRRPINGFRPIKVGSKPIDGGYFIFSESEKIAFLKKEPKAKIYMHPYIGAKEFLKGTQRYILYLGDAKPTDLRKLPETGKLIRKVKDYRLCKIPHRVKETYLSKPNDLARTPTAYHITVVPQRAFMVIPEVSSERREYVPIGWLNPPAIPSNLVKVINDATLEEFALLTSKMHMSWLRVIGGRLESRYRYSIGLVYNNFPVPNGANLSSLKSYAQNIVDARNSHPTQALEDLYDPDLMPSDLRSAHEKLDRAVDKLYRSKKFIGDQDRVEYLLSLYEKMIF